MKNNYLHFWKAKWRCLFNVIKSFFRPGETMVFNLDTGEVIARGKPDKRLEEWIAEKVTEKAKKQQKTTP